jgi:hypothetical protein
VCSIIAANDGVITKFFPRRDSRQFNGEIQACNYCYYRNQCEDLKKRFEERQMFDLLIAKLCVMAARQMQKLSMNYSFNGVS